MAEREKWYREGLSFTCTQCGNCCTGGPGFVWISREEIVRLGEHLKLTPYEVVERYCRKIDGQFSLTERLSSRGEYDCVFLQELPAEDKQQGDEGEETVRHTRRVCSIYAARPLQCRTWPFWEGNLASREAWDRAGQRCHGINRGKGYTKERIEALRDAKEWPDEAPTSGDEMR